MNLPPTQSQIIFPWLYILFSHLLSRTPNISNYFLFPLIKIAGLNCIVKHEALSVKRKKISSAAERLLKKPRNRIQEKGSALYSFLFFAFNRLYWFHFVSLMRKVVQGTSYQIWKIYAVHELPFYIKIVLNNVVMTNRTYKNNLIFLLTNFYHLVGVLQCFSKVAPLQCTQKNQSGNDIFCDHATAKKYMHLASRMYMSY